MQPGTIHEDIPPVLQAWDAGKPVRALAIGHTQRMTAQSGEADRIDLSRLVRMRQTVAYEWVFLILNYYQTNGAPEAFEDFSAMCDELEATHMPDGAAALSEQELEAAESLAWKALLIGWKRAMAGHEEGRYIEVKKPVASGE